MLKPPGSITEEICYGCFLPDLAGFTALLAPPEESLLYRRVIEKSILLILPVFALSPFYHLAVS